MRHGEGQESVCRVVNTVWRRQVSVSIAERTSSRRSATVVKMRRQHFELEIQQCLNQAGLHQPPASSDSAANQASKNSFTQIVSRQHVSDGKRHGRRRVAIITAEPHDSGPRLRQQVLPRAIAPLLRSAVAGNHAIDNSGVDSAHAFVAQAEALDHSGPEVLNHYVGSFDQFFELPYIAWTLKICRVALLIAIDRVEQGVL